MHIENENAQNDPYVPPKQQILIKKFWYLEQTY